VPWKPTQGPAISCKGPAECGRGTVCRDSSPARSAGPARCHQGNRGTRCPSHTQEGPRTVAACGAPATLRLGEGNRGTRCPSHTQENLRTVAACGVPATLRLGEGNRGTRCPSHTQENPRTVAACGAPPTFKKVLGQSPHAGFLPHSARSLHPPWPAAYSACHDEHIPQAATGRAWGDHPTIRRNML